MARLSKEGDVKCCGVSVAVSYLGLKSARLGPYRFVCDDYCLILVRQHGVPIPEASACHWENRQRTGCERLVLPWQPLGGLMISRRGPIYEIDLLVLSILERINVEEIGFRCPGIPYNVYCSVR